jgi:hemerythrin
MESTPLSAELISTIAEEHESLANRYGDIFKALEEGPGGIYTASKLLDELVEHVAEHFVHEEDGGYYSHVVEAAPWRARVVDDLKDQHAELLKMIRKIAGDARQASQSRFPCETVWKEFAEFLHSCADHEARENRLVQEVYVLDIQATD